MRVGEWENRSGLTSDGIAFSAKGTCSESGENLEYVRVRKEGKSSLFWFLERRLV